MINLLALKHYEESHIAQLHPEDKTRKWWNALSFQEQCAISSGSQLAKDLQADKRLAEENA